LSAKKAEAVRPTDFSVPADAVPRDRVEKMPVAGGDDVHDVRLTDLCLRLVRLRRAGSGSRSVPA
jgi:hypothetical protein